MKYTIHNNVFIVWGGNHSLAEKIQKRLASKKIYSKVGGTANSSGETSFLGPRILKQMNECSQVIILANPNFDEDRTQANFRGNLMFEWGYLLGRLPHQKIHVYLINCERSDLPTDLHGTYTAVVPSVEILVPNKNNPSMAIIETAQAKFISNDFISEQYQDTRPSVYSVFCEWPEWSKFAEEQLDFSIAPQPTKLRKVMRSAFIPISYDNNELVKFIKLFKKIDFTGDENCSDLIVSKGLGEYLKLTRRGGRYKRGEFDSLKKRFSPYANQRDPIISIFVRYGMTLCLMSESFHKSHNKNESKKLREYAKDHAETAIDILNGVSTTKIDGSRKIELDEESITLISGYIYGNLGKLCFLLGDVQSAVKHYQSSIDSRQDIETRLDLSDSHHIVDIYKLETSIHRLRLMQISGYLNEESISEIENDIQNSSLQVPHQMKAASREVERCREFMKHTISSI